MTRGAVSDYYTAKYDSGINQLDLLESEFERDTGVGLQFILGDLRN